MTIRCVLLVRLRNPSYVSENVESNYCADANAALLPKPPVYVPFISVHAPHAYKNTVPELDEDNSLGLAGAIFKLFLTDDVLAQITTNTNVYAIMSAAYDNETARPFPRLRKAELKVWFGIYMLMGVTHEPSVEDYWRPNDMINSYHPMVEHMTLKRWQQIKRYLHITLPSSLCMLNEDDAAPNAWTAKVQWLLDHLMATSRRLRTLGSHVSLDESMIQQTGRSSHKYFMPGKPIAEGHKLYVIAEKGYVHAIYPDSPVPSARIPLEKVPNLSPDDRANLCRTSEIVLHLALSLPSNEHYFELIMDNLFCTPRLFRILRDHLGMGAYGTLRTTNFPKVLDPATNKMVNSVLDVPATYSLPYHHLTGGILDGNVLMVLWMDNRPVKLLTTVHVIHPTGPTMDPAAHIAHIDKLRKRPSIRRCRAPVGSIDAIFNAEMEEILTEVGILGPGPVREEEPPVQPPRDPDPLFDEPSTPPPKPLLTPYTRTIKIPRIIDDYNRNMGGVDIANQYRTAYTVHRPTRRTWMPLFGYIIDTMLNNSYLIFRDLQKERGDDGGIKSHQDFIRWVAWELILQGADWAGNRKCYGRDNDEAVPPGVHATSDGLSIDRHEGIHLPVIFESRRRCYLCSHKYQEGRRGGGLNVRTRMGCSTCDRAFCFNEFKNCWGDFHK